MLHGAPLLPLADRSLTMPCSRIVALLIDYVEQRLPDERRQELERHLADCGSCTAALNTYRSTISLLASLDEDDLPPELRTRLRAFLERESGN